MFEFLLSDSYVNVGLLVVCCQMKFYAKINISYLVSLLIHSFSGFGHIYLWFHNFLEQSKQANSVGFGFSSGIRILEKYDRKSDKFSYKTTDKFYSSSFEDLLTTIKEIYLHVKAEVLAQRTKCLLHVCWCNMRSERVSMISLRCSGLNSIVA